MHGYIDMSLNIHTDTTDTCLKVLTNTYNNTCINILTDTDTGLMPIQLTNTTTKYLFKAMHTDNKNSVNFARYPSLYKLTNSFPLILSLVSQNIATHCRVKICGKQASREEAPILVLAPHRSCMDALV